MKEFKYKDFIFRQKDGNKSVKIRKYEGNAAEIEIPEIVECGNKTFIVDEIDSDAFQGNIKLLSVKIPDSVQYIGGHAFAHTYLRKVEIADSVCNFGFVGTFEHCLWLPFIKLPASLKEIPSRAFCRCYNLSTVIFPESIASIGKDAFYDAMLVNIVFTGPMPPSLEGDAFSAEAAEATVFVPKGSLHRYKPLARFKNFREYDLKYLSDLEKLPFTPKIISEENRTVEVAKFIGLPRDLTIPAQIDFLGICYTVERIGFCAFDGAPDTLQSVTLPYTVEEISSFAFQCCSKIRTIECHAVIPPIVEVNAFSDVPADAVLYVPRGSKADYASDPAWARFSDIRELDS